MRVITLDTNKKVIEVKDVGETYKLETNDIASELGEMGQIQQADGSFLDDTTPIIPPVIQPTNKEVYDITITLMDVLATMYEGMIEKGTV